MQGVQAQKAFLDVDEHYEVMQDPSEASPRGPQKEPAAVPTPKAVQVAWQWINLLCCTAVQTRLPFAALQLLNDLVQLLFYHTQQASAKPGPPPAEAEAKTQLQVCHRLIA